MSKGYRRPGAGEGGVGGRSETEIAAVDQQEKNNNIVL